MPPVSAPYHAAPCCGLLPAPREKGSLWRRRAGGAGDGYARVKRSVVFPILDRDDALVVINGAAQWYREFLLEEEWHEPEMTPAQWEAEAQRTTWYRAFVGGKLVGTMGLEYRRDAVLLRHAYILPAYQHQGIDTRLLEYLECQVQGV